MLKRLKLSSNLIKSKNILKVPSFISKEFQKNKPNNFFINSIQIYNSFSNCSQISLTKKKEINRFYCGLLNKKDIEKKVKLNGWIHSIRNLGKIIFIILRDCSGTIQLKYSLENTSNEEIQKQLKNVTLESVIEVYGIVKERPLEMKNSTMNTGDIEVEILELKILNISEYLPFDIRSDIINEELRLRYRFLDLRRSQMQHNLRIRSDVYLITRNFFHEEGFLEIETPTLFKKTVESGAKEFLVPTRNIGKFYALPQSPQQYKQLLMVGGLEKYFQIARCYRDEGQRADRQPEFTQIDLEMSFITPENIYILIEKLLSKIWLKILNQNINIPFLKMKFDDAISNYGSDKPDTRYDMKIYDVTEIFKSTNITIFNKIQKEGGFIKCLNIKKFGNLTSKELLSIQQEAKNAGAEGLITIQIFENEWKSTIDKYLSSTEKKQLATIMGVEKDDLLLIGSGPHLKICQIMGKLRIYCANLLQSKGLLTIPPNQFNFLWVIDFPLFSLENNSELVSTHHPFTSPLEEDIPLLDKNKEELLKIRALHYDIVCNGMEIGGGSIRIHNPNLQKKIFEILNIKSSQIKQFDHLLEAFRYGCPPHGGIALGLDRLISILCGVSSIRDVIAFPKSSTGNDLMTGAPSEIATEELKEFGLKYDLQS